MAYIKGFSRFFNLSNADGGTEGGTRVVDNILHDKKLKQIDT